MIVWIVLATWVGLAVVCAPLVGMALRRNADGLAVPGVELADPVVGPARRPSAASVEPQLHPRRRSSDAPAKRRVVA